MTTPTAASRPTQPSDEHDRGPVGVGLVPPHLQLRTTDRGLATLYRHHTTIHATPPHSHHGTVGYRLPQPHYDHRTVGHPVATPRCHHMTSHPTPPHSHHQRTPGHTVPTTPLPPAAPPHDHHHTSHSQRTPGQAVPATSSSAGRPGQAGRARADGGAR
ncbi:hypothetical protein BJY18_000262 [Amycolatopsis jiangsuensis]|uniref:Uncharacterized protein n=1 Tax=Amycolatopsis jiangsuensis TaxID=1181879 RepID=A0A840IN21_9PSEU|nr:hypothetical protein [Amycolatopsis jiangsuensis]